MLKHLLVDESGASAVEYGLIAGLVAVVIIVAATSLGEALVGVFDRITGKLETLPTN